MKASSVTRTPIAIARMTLVPIFLLVCTVLPHTVTAQSYQPSSTNEFIAYLQGVIATLEAQTQAQGPGTPVATLTGTEVSTTRSSNRTSTSATLEGEVVFGTARSVQVYFEYGTSRTSLNRRTTEKRLVKVGASDDFSARVTGLRDDRTYYYRAVVKLTSGRTIKGSIRSFSLDDDWDQDDNFDDEDNDSDDGTLSISRTTVSAGNSISVRYTVPSQGTSQSWVGLFSVNDSNMQYRSYQYTSGRSGTLTFTAPYNTGRYEFRLFKDNGYTKIGESSEFRVN